MRLTEDREMKCCYGREVHQRGQYDIIVAGGGMAESRRRCRRQGWERKYCSLKEA
ncbi:MAG: hypothetical protein ACLR23_25595 [Clostridia bacterium]